MRHDLQGQAVEDMAPEHVHHALVEVWRRHQGRGDDALRARTVERMAQAFEASGMSREAWREHLQGRDESANAMLDEALTQAAAQAARDEALLRAFEASGQTVEGFAGDYGLNPSEAGVTLARARKRRDAVRTSWTPSTLPRRAAPSAAGAVEIAKILFFIFAIMAIVSFVVSLVRKG